jgi:hypothetical protein
MVKRREVLDVKKGLKSTKNPLVKQSYTWKKYSFDGETGNRNIVINTVSSYSRLRGSQFRLLCAAPLLVRGARTDLSLHVPPAALLLLASPLLPLCSGAPPVLLRCSPGAPEYSLDAPPYSLGAPSKAALLTFPNRNGNFQS